MPMPAISTALLSEIVLIALIAVVVFVIFKIGGRILKLFFGIIANSILGIIAIFLVDYFFHMGIPLVIYTLIPTALFGLPAVGTLIILKFFGALA